MMKVVKVKWVDAQCLEEWMDHEESEEYCQEEPAPSFTVGFLISESNTHVSVAQTYDEEHAVNLWKIPRGMIVSIEVINEHEIIS